MGTSEVEPAHRAPLLHWMIFTGLSLFGFVLLWRFGLIRLMVVSDRTYISSLIVVLYFGTSLHCLWRSIVLSRESEAAARAARRLARGGAAPAAVGDAGLPPKGLIAGYIRDLAAMSARQGGRGFDPTLALRHLAARLRGSNRFGAFASDMLMKLGLVGTIVGFIMMLAPVAGLELSDRSAIKSSMNLMSGGMAVAMYTTLAGLVGSILIRIQYYMLDDAAGRLVASAIRLADAHLAAAVEPRAERTE